MPSLIRKDLKTIEIKLFYKEVTNKNGFSKIVIISDEEIEKIINTDQMKNVSCLTTKWKQLTWGDQNYISQEASYFNEERGFYDVNIFKLRDLRLKRALINWDMVDEDNRPVPLTGQNIDQLPDEIVNKLLEKYENYTSLTKDEEKKIGEAMVEYLNGRWPSNRPLPKEISEYMIVRETGWTLEYIRKLAYRDFQLFTVLSVIYSKISQMNERKKIL